MDGTIQKELADNANELTSIWNIGINKRKELDHSGIFKWNEVGKDDVQDKVYQIVKVNVSDKKYLNVVDKLPDDKYFYVDFETVNNLSNDDSKIDTLIYIIGCGYIENNTWKCKQFKLNSYSLKEERKIIDEWINFMYKKYTDFKIIHWSPAEKVFSKSTSTT